MTPPLQALMNAPAAIGSAVTMARKPGGGPGSQVRYGLTMWFKVVVEHAGGKAQSLGLWSGCSGLGVTLKPDELREGGDYNGPVYFPGEIGYGQITLERAMDRKGSAAVRAWLADVAADWNSAGDHAIGAHRTAARKSPSLVITLYSNLKQEGQDIASWELREVIPVAWSGPALSAKGAEVAVEKLTLAHAGFLRPGAGKQAAGAARREQPDQGRLKISYGADALQFDYNPLKVSLDRAVSIKSESLTVTIDQQVVDQGKLGIKLNDLWVEGVADVQSKVEKLLGWLEPEQPTQPPPQPSPAGSRDAGESNSAKAKLLKVEMGAGTGRINRTALLKSVNVTYTRFTRASVPSRATVSLTMEGVDIPPAAQNPTSGGPPGGRLHTVTAGDNLQRIAVTAYGTASSWRRIAEANDVDDPLRVRSGQSVYLPAR